MTNFQKEVIELLNQNLSVSQISKITNRPMSSISSVIKRFNITNYKKEYVNTVNHQFFDTINTEEKAYFLGLLIADGSIYRSNESKGRISFILQEEDVYILKALKKSINSENNIYIRYNLKGAKCRKPQASFRWSSEYMSNILINKYKITQNKTMNLDFTFPFQYIPKNLQGAFIRGFIDGDGSFESKNGTFNASIVGTSKNWICQIGDIISQETGLSYKVYENKGKTCDYYALRWSANNIDKFDKITKLYNFLYKNATIYLKRKISKIEAYLEYRAKQLGVTSPVSVTHRN